MNAELHSMQKVAHMQNPATPLKRTGAQSSQTFRCWCLHSTMHTYTYRQPRSQTYIKIKISTGPTCNN
jgi:hypothetical protein